jgi:hypothetical protein
LLPELSYLMPDTSRGIRQDAVYIALTDSSNDAIRKSAVLIVICITIWVVNPCDPLQERCESLGIV